jgi:PhzF family phenazine biosynthesis protein
MQLNFITVDVFTDQQFGGNPLAVVLNGHGLTTEQMQSIAAEFNLAETTFVLPPKGPHTAEVRIFTPRAELPFAGHPNIGTAFVLATLGNPYGSVISDPLVFEEKAGLVKLDLIRNGTLIIGARLAAPQPSFRNRQAPTPDSFRLCSVLQSSPYALGITERCAVTSSRPIVWRHRSHSDPGRATSSICPDMIFGKDRAKRTSH